MDNVGCFGKFRVDMGFHKGMECIHLFGLGHSHDCKNFSETTGNRERLDLDLIFCKWINRAKVTVLGIDQDEIICWNEGYTRSKFPVLYRMRGRRS